MNDHGLKRECLEFGSFRLYPDERLLLKDGDRVPLTPRVLDLLIVLVRHRGQVVTKERLFESVWPGSYVEEGNINKTVSNLRKILGVRANGSDFIETVPKTGYRFVAPVIASADEHETDLLAIPWSAVRRPIFWMGTVSVVAFAAILGSSFAPSMFRTQAIEGPATSTAAVHPSEPVQLTFNAVRDAYPNWTREGRIRYQNFGLNKQGASQIMDSNGENQTTVSDIPGLRQGGWSPDGRRLIFWRHDDRAMYLADADGGNEKKLSFIPGGIHWSPDGNRLVYQGLVTRDGIKDWDIFVYDLNSDRSVNLTDDPALDADPSWSPDGREIVFNSKRDGNAEIYLMNADGSGLRRLTDHPAWDSHPTFAPDGTQILFNSNRENADSDIHLMNTDGSDVRKLVEWESNEEIGPGCWSPDGTKIAFVSDRSGNDEIYLVDVDPIRPRLVHSEQNANIGSGVYSPDGMQVLYQAELPDKSGEVRIRDLESGEVRSIVKTTNWHARPTWSPDGSRIAFQNSVDGIMSLFIIGLDGGNLVRLIGDEKNGANPVWSPDGKNIVFISANYGPNRLFTVSADTFEQRALKPNDGWEADPAWSPDGTKIVFACDRQDVPGNALDICLMDADGQNERRLLSRKGHDNQPVWSPDGSRIAFVATGDGNDEIYVMRSDGSGLLRLTRNEADDHWPHWSPDGSRIIFTSDRGGKSAIYEIAL